MLSSREPKRSLSKNLLQMKFMQRKQEECLKQEQEKEYKIKLNEEHWYIDNPELEEEIRETQDIEPSFVVCEDLLPIGRMSFRNFNPAVDKIYAEALHKRNLRMKGIKDDDTDEGISDEEMARRYESLVETVGKKFSRKRKAESESESSDSDEEEKEQKKSKKHKSGFLKPKLD